MHRNVLHPGLCLAVVLPVLVATSLPAAAPSPASEAGRLTAAVFVQNHADPRFDMEVDTLRDLLVSKLTRSGMRVVEKADIKDRLKERQTVSPLQLENMLRDEAEQGSALRLAQMLSADLVVIANLNAMNKRTRQAEVYGVKRAVETYESILSLRILDGTDGGTLVGDTATVRVTASPSEAGGTPDETYFTTVFDQATTQLADAVAAQADALQDVRVTARELVKFTITTNVDSVDVNLDGVVLGTAPGTFYAAPGLHQVTLSRQWMEPWNKPINVINDQAYTVAMELSREGIDKFQDLEGFKADVENERLLAEARAKMLSESFIKFDGELQSLSVGDRRGLDQIINIDNQSGAESGGTP